MARRLSRSRSSRRIRACRSGVIGCRFGSGTNDRPHPRHRATADPARCGRCEPRGGPRAKGRRGVRPASRQPTPSWRRGHCQIWQRDPLTRHISPTAPALVAGSRSRLHNGGRRWPRRARAYRPARRFAAMPSAARGRAWNDRLWERVAPLLPPRPPHPTRRPTARRRPLVPRRAGVRPPQRPAVAADARVLPVRGDGLAAAPGRDEGRGVGTHPGRARRRRPTRGRRAGRRRPLHRGQRGASGSARAGSAGAPRPNASGAGTAPRSGRRRAGRGSTRGTGPRPPWPPSRPTRRCRGRCPSWPTGPTTATRSGRRGPTTGSLSSPGTARAAPRRPRPTAGPYGGSSGGGWWGGRSPGSSRSAGWPPGPSGGRTCPTGSCPLPVPASPSIGCYETGSRPRRVGNACGVETCLDRIDVAARRQGVNFGHRRGTEAGGLGNQWRIAHHAGARRR